MDSKNYEPEAFEELGAMSSARVLERFGSDFNNGLIDREVDKRLERFGPNQVQSKPSQSIAQLLFRQFASSVVALLLVAALVSFLTGDHLQAMAILVAVFINAIVGFVTEWRAGVSLAALEKIASPTSRVRRQGHDSTVPASALVPGDLVILESGSRVPADLRIVEAASLWIDESVLTGESISKPKSAELIEGSEDLTTLAYHGSHVLDGRGIGLVVRTGVATSLGELQCSLIEGHSQPTPLEKGLEELGKQLSVLTIVVCALVLFIGVIYKHDIWT
ncbi:MAG: hypothetical protein K8F91_02415, partial [Candidatus Obscuribacterales bacterium]|nr:hypothetical protein [Candidatus Obscuribacterales bacterium]